MAIRSLVPLDLTGLPFARRPAVFRSTRGTPYKRWVPYGMPQLGQYKWISDTVFFLYPSVEDAVKGSEFGGTGFFVAVPSVRWGDQYWHVHGISNWHVAVRGGSSVVRINRKDGGTDSFDFEPHEWTFRPGWHDIAISPPLPIDPDQHRVEACDVRALLTEDNLTKDDIGPADDVFMVGRFIDYCGLETNMPAYRFGNVSIVNAQVKQPTGYLGGSFVVDMHSRSGYSGSPVWLYRTPGSVFNVSGDLSTTWHYVKLLGIHWGQFPEKWELKEERPAPWKAAADIAGLVTDGHYVEGLSGMSCVAPSSAMIELLGHQTLQAMRDQIEENMSPEMSRCLLPKCDRSYRGGSAKQALDKHLQPGPKVVRRDLDTF
jgi:hypothetical protein